MNIYIYINTHLHILIYVYKQESDRDRDVLCSPGCLLIHDSPASASQVTGSWELILWVCTIDPCIILFQKEQSGTSYRASHSLYSSPGSLFNWNQVLLWPSNILNAAEAVAQHYSFGSTWMKPVVWSLAHVHAPSTCRIAYVSDTHKKIS